MRISWDTPRLYEDGLDRGVLYIPGKAPVPWTGLTSFDEGSSGTTAMYYRDGVVFLADAEPSDFSAKLGALFFPDEFHECLGIPEATDGLYVDNQKPKQFGLSYRTLIGEGGRADPFGFQIHLVYGCMASIAPRSRVTMGASSTPVDLSFDIVCTPVKMTGYRPTSHYIIDTRNMSPSRVTELEDIIYGTAETDGALPDVNDLFDMLNFGDAITVTLHTDGYFTVEGSSANVYATGPYSFEMDNINGADLGGGFYSLSDGGTTDVIIE